MSRLQAAFDPLPDLLEPFDLILCEHSFLPQLRFHLDRLRQHCLILRLYAPLLSLEIADDFLQIDYTLV